MPHFTKPAEGSWTEHFGLDTEPVSYEDSISPEFYEVEREAVFKRTWLNVGRVEQLTRNGSYFTKDVAIARLAVEPPAVGVGQVAGSRQDADAKARTEQIKPTNENANVARSIAYTAGRPTDAMRTFWNTWFSERCPSS